MNTATLSEFGHRLGNHCYLTSAGGRCSNTEKNVSQAWRALDGTGVRRGEAHRIYRTRNMDTSSAGPTICNRTGCPAPATMGKSIRQARWVKYASAYNREGSYTY